MMDDGSFDSDANLESDPVTEAIEQDRTRLVNAAVQPPSKERQYLAERPASSVPRSHSSGTKRT